jgi:hypothetical protein
MSDLLNAIFTPEFLDAANAIAWLLITGAVVSGIFAVVMGLAMDDERV